MRILALLLALPALAQAHDGHGAIGSHLHPAEALGLLALIVGAVLVLARLWKK